MTIHSKYKKQNSANFVRQTNAGTECQGKAVASPIQPKINKNVVSQINGRGPGELKQKTVRREKLEKLHI
jgi:hypothetical protein